MPLNEIPEFFHPEIRQLIDFALEDAWQEIRNAGLADTASVRGRLATTIVALAAIGETGATSARPTPSATTRQAISDYENQVDPPIQDGFAPCQKTGDAIVGTVRIVLLIVFRWVGADDRSGANVRIAGNRPQVGRRSHCRYGLPAGRGRLRTVRTQNYCPEEPATPR
jgi:hypothetical protein